MNWLQQFAHDRSSAAEGENWILADWLDEVNSARQGTLAEWSSWSPECRGRWAGCMLHLASENGIQSDVPEDEWRWLEGVGRLQPPPGRAAA
jgi:hypothetical protein